MRFTIFLIALTISALPLLAQDRPEGKGPHGKKHAQATEQTAPRFVDEDGDGIDDRGKQNPQSVKSSPDETSSQGKKQQLRMNRRDRFIDQDGDGINDERCSGTGLRQGYRHGAAKGGDE